MQQSDPHPAGRDAAAALLTPKSADGCIVASSDASVLPYYRANSGLHAKLVRSSTERAVQQQPPPRQQSSPTAPATKYARPAARPTHRGHTRSLTPGASTTTIISRLQATRSIQQLGGDHRSSKLANLVKLNNLGHSLYKPRQFIPDSSDIDEEDGGDRGSPGLGEDEGSALASHSQSIIMRHQYLGLALVRSISALPAETTTTSNSGGGGGNSSGASGQQSAAGNASEGTNQAPMAGCSLSYSSPPDVAVTTTALATPGDDCYSDYFYYQRFRLSTRSSHRLRQDAAVAADNKDERVGGDEGICEPRQDQQSRSDYFKTIDDFHPPPSYAFLSAVSRQTSVLPPVAGASSLSDLAHRPSSEQRSATDTHTTSHRKSTSISTVNTSSTHYFDALSVNFSLASPPQNPTRTRPLDGAPVSTVSPSRHTRSFSLDSIIAAGTIAPLGDNLPPLTDNPLHKSTSNTGPPPNPKSIVTFDTSVQPQQQQQQQQQQSEDPTATKLGRKSSFTFSYRFNRNNTTNSMPTSGQSQSHQQQSSSKMHKRSFWSIFRSSSSTVNDVGISNDTVTLASPTSNTKLEGGNTLCEPPSDAAIAAQTTAGDAKPAYNGGCRSLPATRDISQNPTLSPLIEGPDDYASSSSEGNIDDDDNETTAGCRNDNAQNPNSSKQDESPSVAAAVTAPTAVAPGATVGSTNPPVTANATPRLIGAPISPIARPHSFGECDSGLISPLTLPPKNSKLFGSVGFSVKRSHSVRARPSPLAFKGGELFASFSRPVPDNDKPPAREAHSAGLYADHTSRGEEGDAKQVEAAKAIVDGGDTHDPNDDDDDDDDDDDKFNRDAGGPKTAPLHRLESPSGEPSAPVHTATDFDPASPDGILHRKAKAIGMSLYYIEKASIENITDNLEHIPDHELTSESELPQLEEHVQWLGKPAPLNNLALKYYMDMHDFTGLRIDEGLRIVCNHILLRGESQVIDRILQAFARRHQECNPSSALRGVDVAHAVAYSTLLLNTDLHIANIRPSERMSRSRFVRNTLDTISQFSGFAQHPVHGRRSVPTTPRTGGISFSLKPNSQPGGGTQPRRVLPPQLPELNLASPAQAVAQMFGADYRSPPQSAITAFSSDNIVGSPTKHAHMAPSDSNGGANGSGNTIKEGSAGLLEGEDDYRGEADEEGEVNCSQRRRARPPGGQGHSVHTSASFSFDQSHQPRSLMTGIANGQPIVQSRSTHNIHRLINFRSKRFSMLDNVPSDCASSLGSHGVSSGMFSSSLSRPFRQLRRKVSVSDNHDNNASSKSLSLPAAGGHDPHATGLGISSESSTINSVAGYLESDVASISSQHADYGGGNYQQSRKANGAIAHPTITRAMSAIDMRDISTLLKDIYSSIKHTPLGQPAFARSSMAVAGASRASTSRSSSQLSGFLPRASMTLRETPIFGRRSSIQKNASSHGRKQALGVVGPASTSLSQLSEHNVSSGTLPTHMPGSTPSFSGVAAGPTPAKSFGGGGIAAQQQQQQQQRAIKTDSFHMLSRSQSDALLVSPPQTAGQIISSGPITQSATSIFLSHNQHQQQQHLYNPYISRPDTIRSSTSHGSRLRTSASSSNMYLGISSNGGGAFSPRPIPATQHHNNNHHPTRSPIEGQYIRSGMLTRKHLYERASKKASHRSWRRCYVTVDRGMVSMYKVEGRNNVLSADGRELTDISLQLGSVSLRHTMTQMMPPPGYSRSRPHVFALQLPNGGVYLFQTETEAELKEWVDACNYWASCESKAPYMIGGVFNMEYGWDNTGEYVKRQEEKERREERGETFTAAEMQAEEARIHAERERNRGINILDWSPPNNPMQRSGTDETEQLRVLMNHIAYLEEDLVSHKKLMGSIDERFYPRTPQHQKAFQNWERKAQYILKELIKYQTYADCLQKAVGKAAPSLSNGTSPVNSAGGGDGGSLTTHRSVAFAGANVAGEQPSRHYQYHRRARSSGSSTTTATITFMPAQTNIYAQPLAQQAGATLQSASSASTGVVPPKLERIFEADGSAAK